MKRNRLHIIFIAAMIAFFALLVGMTILLVNKNNSEMKEILSDSVKAQLLSTSYAARSIVDVDWLASLESVTDIEQDFEYYQEILTRLRTLKRESEVTYIYVLKYFGEKAYFVFDTDYEDTAPHSAYQLSCVHETAFLGTSSADVFNVVDEWGSYSTGAVPIFYDGIVIGIVAVDVADILLERNLVTARTNIAMLLITMVITMIIMLAIVWMLLSKIHKMDQELYYRANYDAITGLPNRRFLMNYLKKLTEGPSSKDTSFALLFIDLDNFKNVNDTIGHGGGDELLYHVGSYLSTILPPEKAMSFRPSAGKINVSARVGGDEFVQIVHDIKTEEEAKEVTNHILSKFHSEILDPIIEKCDIGLSIGVALYPLHSTDYNVIIKYADDAMYQVKNSGKHGYCIYKFGMASEKSNKSGWEKT